MADNSNIVLIWDINTATADFAARKVESGVYDEGGFRWTVSVEKVEKEVLQYVTSMGVFSLRCGVDHNGPWKCDAEVKYSLHAQDGTSHIFDMGKKRCSFDHNNNVGECNNSVGWSIITDPYFNVNDKVTVEFRIKIIDADRGMPVADSGMFAAPSNKSNIILKIGDEKLHVSKEFLAFHSPVLEILFFGDFAEKGKEEIEIKDVVYDEFLDLLNLLYLGTVDITDRTVPHILKLSDRFQMERVLNLSEKFLIQSNGFDVMKKLLFADQYRLASLKDNCLKSFTSLADLGGKMKSPECKNFSDAMKVAIYDRMTEL